MINLCVTQRSIGEISDEKYFSVGEAARAVHTTSETLRHYDRIGLVKPSRKDEWTNYRYYTEQDIVRLNTVRALQMMDLSLQEIKKVLDYDDLKKIVGFLARAEQKADEKSRRCNTANPKSRRQKRTMSRNSGGANSSAARWSRRFRSG